MNVDVGQVIAGKYELVKLLGKGAMGEVWLATHNSLGGEFAIKLVEPTDDIEAETAAGRFQLEAQIAAKLSRKTRHIVSVSDHGEEDGLAYLVMELLEGESLEHRTKRRGPLEMPEVAAIVSQVARALSLAHEEDIFHRDLKPANVWLARDEDGRLLVKLLDFGIARTKRPFRTRSPFATSKDMVLGTPSYMSPEQARGLDTLDYRCDLWALAVVAYEALTGKIPFEGDTVEDIFLSICTFRVVPALTRRPDLPPAVEAFFARAFAPKLDDRFSSAAELTEAFERLVTPEELETALGLPLTPVSARRIEAARGSNPRIGSNPSFPSQPNTPQQPIPSDPMYGPRGSAPDFQNVAIGGPTTITRRSGGSTTWLVAIAAVIALLGIGTLGFVAFRGGSSAKTTSTQPVETSAPSVATTSAPIPEPPASTAIIELTPPPPAGTQAPPTTAKASPTLGRPKTPNGVKTTGAVTSPPVQTSATTHASPAPTPTTAKTVNKGEVF